MKYGRKFNFDDFSIFSLNKHRRIKHNDKKNILNFGTVFSCESKNKCNQSVQVIENKNQCIQSHIEYEEKGIQIDENLDSTVPVDVHFVEDTNLKDCTWEKESDLTINLTTNIEKVAESDDLQVNLKSELQDVLHIYQQLFKDLKEIHNTFKTNDQKKSPYKNCEYIVYPVEVSKDNNSYNLISENSFQITDYDKKVNQSLWNYHPKQEFEIYLNDETRSYHKTDICNDPSNNIPENVFVSNKLRRMEPYESKLYLHNLTPSDVQCNEREKNDVTPVLAVISSSIYTKCNVEKSETFTFEKVDELKQTSTTSLIDIQPISSKTPYESDLHLIKKSGSVRPKIKKEDLGDPVQKKESYSYKICSNASPEEILKILQRARRCNKCGIDIRKSFSNCKCKESDGHKKFDGKPTFQDTTEFLNDLDSAKYGKVDDNIETVVEANKSASKKSISFSPNVSCRKVSYLSNEKDKTVPCTRIKKENNKEPHLKESNIKNMKQKCMSNLEKGSRRCSGTKIVESNSKTVIFICPSKRYKKLSLD